MLIQTDWGPKAAIHIVGHVKMREHKQMKQTLCIPFWLLGCLAVTLWGCGNDVPEGEGRDCSVDDIGCSPGFSCVLADDGRHRCIADESDADASMPMSDAATSDPDAMVTTPDGTVELDVALPPDGDGDGAADSTDNCVDIENSDQADSDNDGLGDACDGAPNVQNFFMIGHFLTLGGTSVDGDHTLRSKITTGTGELTDGQLILIGELNP
jgi:hypothetical protein